MSVEAVAVKCAGVQSEKVLCRIWTGLNSGYTTPSAPGFGNRQLDVLGRHGEHQLAVGAAHVPCCAAALRAGLARHVVDYRSPEPAISRATCRLAIRAGPAARRARTGAPRRQKVAKKWSKQLF